MRDKIAPRNYDDIIDKAYPFDLGRPRMPLPDRAAQFLAYKALVGYEDMVLETARLTDERSTMDEGMLEQLNARLQILLAHLDEHPQVTLTYFVYDERKTGGSYRVLTDHIQKFDLYDRVLITGSKKTIPIDEIYAISGELFED